MDDIFDQKIDKEIFNDYKPDNEYNKKRKNIITVITVALIVILILGAGVSGVFIGLNAGVSKDLPMMINAYEYIKSYYYKDITWSEFDKLVTSGMISSLDNFSWLNDNSAVSSNFLVGINVSKTKYHRYYISYVIPNLAADTTSAYAHYVYDGNSWVQDTTFDTSQNIKIEIGDSLYAYSTSDENFEIIEGADYPSSTSSFAQSHSVNYYIRKSNGNGVTNLNDIYVFHLIKENITVPQYAYYYSPSEINSTDTALIKYTAFDSASPADFDRCLTQFINDEAKPHKLILDLRNNGGGDLLVAEYIAACLLKGADSKNIPITLLDQKVNKKIVSTIYSSNNHYSYHSGNVDVNVDANNLYSIYDDFELVVLCNNGSASCSEMLMASVQYYDNVQIVGVTSYGKGVAQKTYISNVDPNFTFTLVCGYYYVPTNDENGNLVWTYTLHEKGITPQGENYIEDSLYRPFKNDLYIARALEIMAA